MFLGISSNESTFQILTTACTLNDNKEEHACIVNRPLINSGVLFQFVFVCISNNPC